MAVSHKEIVQRYRAAKKKEKMQIRLAAAVMVACFCLSLCFRTVKPGFIPVEAARNLWTFLKLSAEKYFWSSAYLDEVEGIQDQLYYGETMQRLVISFFTALSGMALGLAGAVFQQMYRNPIASPGTIGATAGVNLGNMVMVLLYSYTALQMILYRYIVCLLLTFGIMVLITAVGSYTGRRLQKCSVAEMLLFGSILSRMITAFVTYAMYHLNGAAMIAYQQMNLGVYQAFSAKSLLLFFVVVAAGLALLLKMRFRINALGFDAMEMKAAGISLGREQLLLQLLSAMLIAAACIQCGDVGLFALVIPHMVRYWKGADFRYLARYSAVFGGIFLLLLRMVSSAVFLGPDPMPMSFLVSILSIPVFMVLLAMDRRGFD